ncbi:hypothetical protein GQ457_11G030870 [Hibiscus cannabinus]
MGSRTAGRNRARPRQTSHLQTQDFSAEARVYAEVICGSKYSVVVNFYSSRKKLHMLEEAIECYKRAANCNDTEAIALHRLAELHRELGHPEEAAFYYKKDLERMEVEERQGPNTVEALTFLATHYRTQKRFEEAEVSCTRLLDYTGPVSFILNSLSSS